jgi:hypothetical protein
MLSDNAIMIPEPASLIVDFVCEEDRRYFEVHPEAKYYDREIYPSEHWPYNIPVKGWFIRVFQIVPGIRTRCVIRDPSGLPKGAKLPVCAEDVLPADLVRGTRRAYKRGLKRARRQ